MATDNMENLDGQDVIGQEQQDLDSQQGIQASTAQPLTEEQVRQIVQQQSDANLREMRGLQGLLDKGLDAIRRDTTADLDRRIAEMQAGAGRQQFLSSLDEEEREKFERVLTLMDAERNAAAPMSQAVSTAATPQEDPMEAAYRYVEASGLQRNNPSINYSILTNSTLDSQQREETFVQNVRNVRDQYVVRQALASNQSAPTQTNSPTNSPTNSRTNSVQHPPIDGGQGMPSQSQAEEDIEADFIADRITETVYRERMAPFRQV